MIKKTLTSLLLFCLCTFSAFALEVPALTGPVVDEAQFLSRDAHRAIENALLNFNQTEGIQFQVLIIDKLVDETVETYSIKVVDEWKLGKKGDDRAALFLISLDDRKMRIEVGRGLEGTLTDLTTHRILDEVKPFFQKGDYDNGVALGLALMAQADGKKLDFQGQVRPRHQRKGSAPLVLIAIFGLIFFLQFFFPNIRGGGGRGGRGGYYGGWGGGGGLGGGGGGSSWSGGGGGFSGGGSSGSW
ncbi:TPM domain-containing protein [Bacteriovorax stolpii]|uniref:Uncharacterized protein n=1 Tax=Bacteriovorax stolpii TaxID=960 RepID=A0A2K9NRZ3_BACTC|nr:TPM domain-containing protein [Bacteriovorax stolpii]AUN98290.1 hypothetical protein C0V70_09270 [Bacteriovorax stolpii]QDK41730.1 TPM domain-containing protein [Bacteriovorax stolpii]TDP52214.1 uncharacterized protein C8D79_2864 [Bacteriovorax stolpii]